MNDDEIPVHFFEHKNQLIMCHISNIVVEKLSDKKNYSSHERASKVLASFLLPSLRSLKPMLELDIPYIGLSYLYGANNTLELKVVGEYISVVSSTKVIKDYLNGMLTLNEFLALSDIYLSDRNMGAELKKTNIFINEE